MTLEEAIIHCEEVADRCAVTDGDRPCEDNHRQLAEWLKELKKLRAVDQKSGEWISVKDRLPTPTFARQWYLVCLESGCVESLAFDRDRNCWWETGSRVTYWMNLPEPPKEET